MKVFSDQDNLLRRNYHCSEILMDYISLEVHSFRIESDIF